MTSKKEWEICISPKIGDTIKWIEPLWAAPNKPRGKRDKVGEQEIIAKLINITHNFEFRVISVKKLSSCETLLSVKQTDQINRKQSSIQKNDCYKLLES